MKFDNQHIMVTGLSDREGRNLLDQSIDMVMCGEKIGEVLTWYQIRDNGCTMLLFTQYKPRNPPKEKDPTCLPFAMDREAIKGFIYSWLMGDGLYPEFDESSFDGSRKKGWIVSNFRHKDPDNALWFSSTDSEHGYGAIFEIRKTWALYGK